MLPRTIQNPAIARLIRLSHEVQVPALCPRTGNPTAGSLPSIPYTPQDLPLEFYSLNEYVASFFSSNEVRGLERLTQLVMRDCHAVPGVPVQATGHYVLNIGQKLSCESEGG